jgi:ribosomal protein S12 methylthiotransferase
VAVARSAADAPEIDGVVRIDRAEALQPGQIVPVAITGASEHDLLAELA